MNEYFENHLTRLATTKQEFAELDEIDLTQYPSSIFKYRPCDQYSFDMLKQQYLYATFPNKSIDDSDSLIRIGMTEEERQRLEKFFIYHLYEICYYNIEPKGMQPKKHKYRLSMCRSKQKQLIKEYNTMKKNNIPFAITDEVRKVLQKFEEPEFENAFETWVTNACQHLRNNLLVCCISDTNNNRKNWEDYSKGFSGFCIEYDLQDNYDMHKSKYIGNLFKMSYYVEDNFPTISVTDMIILTEMQRLGYKINTKEFYINVLKCSLNKNQDYWQEQEWRILSMQSHIPFKIKAVYIGHNCAKHNAARILNICKEQNIPVYQERLNDITGIMKFDLIQ